MEQDAQCKCHSESVATLSGEHVVEGADGSILEGTWEPEVIYKLLSVASYVVLVHLPTLTILFRKYEDSAF